MCCDDPLPSRWFTHFYIWGAFWILSISLVYSRSCVLFQSNPVPILDDLVSLVTGGYISHQCRSVLQQHTDTAVVLGMLSVQVVRRLYECLFVSVFSNARIHLVHYILGMFFYPAVALTALLHLDSMPPQPEDIPDPSPLGVASFLRWYHLLALCLFLWASYHQHICHKILANLRQGKGEGQAYLRPDGDWFELVSCPHFFAEILIYTAVLLCCVSTDGWSCWWLVLVYVVTTLSLSARQAHIWYMQKFEDYPKTRRAIIPWIW